MPRQKRSNRKITPRRGRPPAALTISGHDGNTSPHDLNNPTDLLNNIYRAVIDQQAQLDRLKAERAPVLDVTRRALEASERFLDTSRLQTSPKGEAPAIAPPMRDNFPPLNGSNGAGLNMTPSAERGVTARERGTGRNYVPFSDNSENWHSREEYVEVITRFLTTHHGGPHANPRFVVANGALLAVFIDGARFKILIKGPISRVRASTRRMRL